MQVRRETADITSKKGKRYFEEGRNWFPPWNNTSKKGRADSKFCIVQFSRETVNNTSNFKAIIINSESVLSFFKSGRIDQLSKVDLVDLIVNFQKWTN